MLGPQFWQFPQFARLNFVGILSFVSGAGDGITLESFRSRSHTRAVVGSPRRKPRVASSVMFRMAWQYISPRIQGNHYGIMRTTPPPRSTISSTLRARITGTRLPSPRAFFSVDSRTRRSAIRARRAPSNTPKRRLRTRHHLRLDLLQEALNASIGPAFAGCSNTGGMVGASVIGGGGNAIVG